MDVRSCRWAVVALLAAVLLPLLGSSTAAVADPTAWGTAGAQYSGGVLCTLDGTTLVPMARWLVGGQQAFSTADVVGTPAGDGPAPVGRALAPMVAGDGGVDERTIAVLAALIERHGAGSAAQTAEVSTAVAEVFGGGTTQARCLGQQGTSSADLDALGTEAQQYAGPYAVTATAPPAAPPGTAAPIAVTVRSATGVGVPGVQVTVSGSGRPVVVTTSAQGTATATLTTPAVETTPLTVTVPQPTLLFAPGAPGAIALGTPSGAIATTTLTADLHPHPTLHVDVGGGLLPTGQSVTAAARVAGTYGFAGTGTLTLAGPARPAADGSCSTLPASAFAAAPNAWSHTFAFTGDGPQQVGSSPHLAAGCYVAGGSLTVTGVSPAATAVAPFEEDARVDVVALSVRRTPVPVLALPGPVDTTVTVDGATHASVATTATVYGPVAPDDGRCDTVRWAGARMLDPVAAAPHPAGATDTRSAVVRTPTLTALGCYALRARTVVEQDGRTLTVEPDVGAAGTVVLVMRPAFTLADDRYDTTRGTPMSGRVTVTGTYRYPAVVSVRLRASAPRFDGCRAVTFTAPATGPVQTSPTLGDGTFAFRTPAPTANTCYALEASLQMVDAAQVRVDGPAPGRSTVFLAGRPPEAAHGPVVRHRPVSTSRAEISLLTSVALMLALAGAVVARVTWRSWRRRSA